MNNSEIVLTGKKTNIVQDKSKMIASSKHNFDSSHKKNDLWEEKKS